LTLVLGVIQLSPAGNPTGAAKPRKLAKTETNYFFAPMDINNIFNYYSNNGSGSNNPYTVMGEGFEFPIDSVNGTCIFQDGLVWTAFKQDTLHCGGSTYNHGLQAGRIVSPGTASGLPVPDDPNNPLNRIYRVRPDIRPTSNADTIALETSILQLHEVKYLSQYQSTTASTLLNQYWDDWNNWPAGQGAPYTDVNHDGVYEPGVDIPGFPGADQTQWMVMNDVNPLLTLNLYGSYPLGIEMQRTIWAYSQPGALQNIIFLSNKLINKSGVELDSVYVSQWADPDLGNSTDDAVGCDTALSLGYVYNGAAVDSNFLRSGLTPPSVGFDFLQGPVVPGGAGDTAIFDGRLIAGRKNLPMRAFTFFVNAQQGASDPPLGSASGTPQWYNYMKGLVGSTGLPFPAAVTGGGKFCFPGDPVTNTGPTFIGPAKVSPPTDVRMVLSSGPFTMAAGDTQQIVVAAIAGVGADYLSSISVLKANDKAAQQTYDTLFNAPGHVSAVKLSSAQTPYSYLVSQNFPNPFNPSTTIQYDLPALSRVTIEIFDVLGQKVRTLVDEVEHAGSWQKAWDSRNNTGSSVASGIYFYRIEAVAVSGSAGGFNVTKKMVLER